MSSATIKLFRFCITQSPKSQSVSVSIRLKHTTSNGNVNSHIKSSEFEAYMNPLPDSLRNKWIAKSQSFVRRPIRLALPFTNDNNKVMSLINAQTNGTDLLHILQSNAREINHNCFYNKAMQKCAMFKDWKSVHSIFKLLLSNHSNSANVKPDIVSFNIFINCMALSDLFKSDKFLQILQIMQSDKYAIKPDIITFSSLIKALRKRNESVMAEQCWHLLKSEKHKLIPHKILYCEMIATFAKAHKVSKATQIFNEYIRKIESRECECDSVVFNVYLNCFSRVGDLKGMQSVVALFEQYGMSLSKDAIADVMHGCVKAKEYKQCMAVMQDWIDKTATKPNTAMLLAKCMALVQMIKNCENENENEKCAFYARLNNCVYFECEFYGLDITPMIATTLLEGTIHFYESQPFKIVTVFEALLHRKYIGYLRFHEMIRKFVIDLHLFSLVQSRFVIRYLFGFNKVNPLIAKDKELLIIVGRGKHASGGDKIKGGLRECIKSELRSWNPPINARVCAQNEGVLLVSRDDLMPYLQCKREFSMVDCMHKSK